MGGPLGENGLIPVSTAADRMSGGVLLSVALHVVFGGLFVFGLPTLFQPPPPKETPIAVALVTVAPQTRATRPNPHRPRPDAKPQAATGDTPAPKPAPKPTPPKPAPPPPSAVAKPLPLPKPPKLAEEKPEPPPARPALKPKPPQPPKAAKVVVPKPPEKPKQLAMAQAEKERRPQPERKPPIHKVKAERTVEERPKVEEKKYDAAQFAALLRNLASNHNAPSPDAPPQERQAPAAGASSQPRAPLGSQLTGSEIDLVIQQIERCWVIPAGAPDLKDLVVEIKAVVNPDGTVQRAWIVDTARYVSDPVFRAAADSAKRAVLNPRCSPLHLPPAKYRAWHNLDLIFNPKDLL